MCPCRADVRGTDQIGAQHLDARIIGTDEVERHETILAALLNCQHNLTHADVEVFAKGGT